MKLYERIENNNFDEIDKNRAIELIEGGNGHLVYNENYFKLQKENEELKNKEKYCILIQKIKAKIEELDIAILECIYIDDDDKAYKKAVKKDKLCLLNQKRALQELLEGRK